MAVKEQIYQIDGFIFYGKKEAEQAKKADPGKKWERRYKTKGTKRKDGLQKAVSDLDCDLRAVGDYGGVHVCDHAYE